MTDPASLLKLVGSTALLSNNLAIPQKPLIPANSNPAPTKPLNKKKPLFTA